MQRRANKGCRLGVLIEQHVFPRNLHVIEDDQRLELIETRRQGVVIEIILRGKSTPTDKAQVRVIEVANESNGIVRECAVSPVGNGGLGERLVGIGRRGFELGPSHHDAVVRFANNVKQHVGVLILGSLGAITLGVSIGRNVKGVAVASQINVTLDVLSKARVNF